MQDTKNISWLNFNTSLFACAADNYGTLRTFRQILFSDFACQHPWFYKDHQTNTWITGSSDDLQTMIDIRNGTALKEEIPLLKQTLQCFTPSASFECKKRGHEKLISTIPILQLDFDYLNNIERTMQEIFSLPFVAYVGKSVSGKGLFALVLIAEPEKLREYAEHCFAVFNYYGLKPDTSKGRNYTDLRFISYDCNALYREYPEPLRIKKFHSPPKPVMTMKPADHFQVSDSKLIEWAVKQIHQAQVGNRFETVRRVAYCLGGYNTGLQEIEQAINESIQYDGLQKKYLSHARDGFKAGQLKPLYEQSA